MKQRLTILAQAKRIPALPPSVQQALEVLRGPEPDMGRLADLLELDPTITANILRLANSPYFRAVQQILTLRDALARLGLRRVQQLLMAVAVAPRLAPALVGYDLPAKALLEHSLAIAVASELLAGALGTVPPPHTFTCGLLANIGKTVLGQFMEVDAAGIAALAQEKGIPFDEAEREVLGTDHAEVGGVLLEAWGLPAEIVEVVRHRLDPDAFEGVNPALDLVHAADAIVRMTGIGQGLDGMQYRLSEKVVERLHLTFEAMEQVMMDLPGYLDKLQDVMAGN